MYPIRTWIAAASGMWMTVVVLMSLSTPVSAVGTQTSDARVGCIVRQGSALRFVETEPRTLGEDAQALAQQNAIQASRVVGACVSGWNHPVPAAFYAGLASRYPDRYVPLPAASQSTQLAPGLSAEQKSLPVARKPYNFVDIEPSIPTGIQFFDPIGLTNDSRVFGTAYDDVAGMPHVAVFDGKKMTVLQDGMLFATNRIGVVAGAVVQDPVNFLLQAAVFRGRAVELIPRLIGEVSSQAVAINDVGAVIVTSTDQNGRVTLAIYQYGKIRPLDAAHDMARAFSFSINNFGTITFTDTGSGPGYRVDARTGQETVLRPLPGDSAAYALQINDRGDVLGYSFGAAEERVGVWHPNGNFQTYFVEGTPAFPTISNALRFNESNVIVISEVQFPADEVLNSYLVPSPGVRLNLASLVRNVPPDEGGIGSVVGINDFGNMTGTMWIGYRDVVNPFLLRMGDAR